MIFYVENLRWKKPHDHSPLQTFTISNNSNEFTKIISRMLEAHNNIKNKHSWLDYLIFIINKDRLREKKKRLDPTKWSYKENTINKTIRETV